MIIAGIILSTTAILIFYFNFKILHKIKMTSNITSNKTFRMQLIFFRAVFVKSIFTIIVLIIPIINLILQTFHVISNVYVIVIIGALQPLHGPMGYILLILLIKPYREFVLKMLCLKKETNVHVINVSTNVK